MFRQWLCIGMLFVMCVPLWAQDNRARAIKRERDEMASEQRVALVIGNANYTNETELDNPINDAEAMAIALAQCGFKTVLKHTDLDRKAMYKAVREFGDQIKRGGVGLFYYSGHGIQVKGQNYLVPVHADIKEEEEVEVECLNMQLVLDKMERAGNRVNILVLDACRNNNFIKPKSSGGGGLAGIERAPKGTFIAYATSPNKVAFDGNGSNSPFTAALVDAMVKRGQKIEEVFKEVRKNVLNETSGRQMPWDATSLTGNFYFRLPLPPVPSGRTQLPTNSVPDRETGLEEVGRIAGESRRFSLPNDASMEFVWVPAGTFMMGSPSSEAGRNYDEDPVHGVTISKGFYLGKYEVTQGQWESVMGTTPWRGMDNVRSSSSYPAVYVSWDAAQEFISRLNSAAGSELYRLPSEAEWEYACRAGTTTRWSFGDDESLLTHYAWYNASVGEAYGHRVGTKRPNAWGLYDMHGNVYEWVEDWYNRDYYIRSSLVDPSGPATGWFRVFRGGGFNGNAQGVRSAARYCASPGYRNDGIGFRLLRRAN